jgi:hypothetical protein
MHRSGTSLVAGICKRLGVNMGDYFRSGDKCNPDGYFEDLDWRAINKWILNTAGGNWYNPPARVDIIAHTLRLAPIIHTLVEHKSHAELWGFKDPRSVLTIRGLSHLLPYDTRYIAVKRDPSSVILSLEKRAAIRGYMETYEHWRGLDLEYNQRLQSFLNTPNIKSLTIKYEDLLTSPLVAWDKVETIANFAGIKNPPTEQAVELIRF